LFDTIGDRRNALAERVDCCFMLLECGLLDELELQSAQAVAQSEELGLTRLSALVRTLGLYGRKQRGQAKEVLSAMRAASQGLGEAHSHFLTATILLAETELAAGEPERALETARRALNVASVMKYW